MINIFFTCKFCLMGCCCYGLNNSFEYVCYVCDCHQTMLHCCLIMQAKIAEFLSLVGNTVVSYLSTYGSDAPEETSDDAQFVLSLCGTVTSELLAGFPSHHTNSKIIYAKEESSLLDLSTALLRYCSISIWTRVPCK